MKANKLDKEFMAKNLFWILLGTLGLLEFIIFIMVAFAGANVAKAESDYAKDKDAMTKAKSRPKYINQHFLPPWKTRQNEYTQKKKDVWGKAWESQNEIARKDEKNKDVRWAHPILTWPTFETPDTQNFLENKVYFGEDISPDIRGEYRNRYRSQIYVGKSEKPSIKTFMYPRGAPADFNFPVDGNAAAIMKPIDWKVDINPTKEECWLAQEDLCLRREVLLMLKEALDTISKFEPVKPSDKEKFPEDVRRFRGRNWEVDLHIKGNTILADSVIRNINPSGRPQALINELGEGTVLRIRQSGQSSQLNEIRDRLVAHGKEAKFGADTTIDSLDLGRDFWVEQVFDMTTSPLKRIEALEIGDKARCHRTVPIALLTGPATPTEEAESSTTTPSPSTDPSSMGPTGMPMMGTMGMGASANDVTKDNGLVKKRYFQVNEQVRRMPIAFSVQVDQAYIQDILAAVANSRLRIQTTQVHWQFANSGVYGGSAGMPMGGPAKSGWEDTSSLGPKGMGPGPGPKPGPGPGPMPMPMPGTGMGETTQADTESVQRNLVELSVYGIASLYNRYPPKEKEDTEKK